MISLQIYIYPDYDALSKATAEHVASVMNDAITARGKCIVALSGGETPKNVYAALASESLKRRVDWENVHIFFGDERMVPADDAQSNFGMVKRELFSNIKIPQKNIHRIWAELGAEEAAIAYEEELQIEMGYEIPQFDLILLGLGVEGHTASLFPDTAALHETERSVSANFIPKLNSWRVTLTLATLNNAREVCFLVSGQNKAEIVQKVLDDESPTFEIPATLISPIHGKKQWMLDADAAALLDSSKYPDLKKF